MVKVRRRWAPLLATVPDSSMETERFLQQTNMRGEKLAWSSQAPLDRKPGSRQEDRPLIMCLLALPSDFCLSSLSAWRLILHLLAFSQRVLPSYPLRAAEHAPSWLSRPGLSTFLPGLPAAEDLPGATQPSAAAAAYSGRGMRHIRAVTNECTATGHDGPLGARLVFSSPRAGIHTLPESDNLVRVSFPALITREQQRALAQLANWPGILCFPP